MKLTIGVDDDLGIEVYAGEERIEGVEAVRFTYRKGSEPRILLALKGCFQGSFSAEVDSTPPPEPEPRPEPEIRKAPACL